jgi:EmrB/QacA subfamily drug resistance transporter
MFMIGIGIFAGASLLGGFATSEAWLLFARVLQGVGGAIASPTALSLVTTTFAAGPARNRAFGVYAAVSGAGAAIGLIMGGVLTDLVSWRWVFFVNVPIALFLILVAPYALPESERRAGRFDLPGALTSTIGVASLVYGFIHAASAGWGNPITLMAFAAAVVFIALFIVIESRSKQPLMPLRLFSDQNRTGSYIVMLAIAAALFSMFFFLTQFVQEILDYSPLKAGFAFLPVSIVIVIVAQIASRLVGRTGPRPLIAVGTLVTAAGLLLLSRMTVDSGYVSLILPAEVVIAIGLALVFVPITLTAVSGVVPTDAGIASAMLNVSQQVGGALGLSALVTVSASAIRSDLASQIAALGTTLPPGTVPSKSTAAAQQEVLKHALAYGWSRAFLAAALITAGAFVVTLLMIRVTPSEVTAGPAEAVEPAVSA